MVSLMMNGRLQPVHIAGQWREKVSLSVPLEVDGTRYGLLQLGPHRDKRAYSDVEGECMQKAADQVARAIQLAWPRYLDGQRQGADIPEASTSASASAMPVLAAQGQAATERQPSGF
jgi:hypothetical protein